MKKPNGEESISHQSVMVSNYRVSAMESEEEIRKAERKLLKIGNKRR